MDRILMQPDDVIAVNLLDMYLDGFPITSRHIFPYISRLNRQFSMAAVHQYRKLYCTRTVKINHGVHGGAHCASGIKHIVYQNNR